MAVLPNLRYRRALPELMDQPGLDEDRHRLALDGLRRINTLSASSRILWPPLRACACTRTSSNASHLRILDIATGGGDVPIQLWQRARRDGLPLEIAGCDSSPFAIRYASQQAAKYQASVSLFPLNVLEEPIPDGYDVIMCSLFLHHLDPAQAVNVLRKMAEAARVLTLVNDLSRGVLGWLLAYFGTRLLSRSSIVHYDGPLSVQGAYTPEEALELAREAGWSNAEVHRKWPCRYLLSGSRA